MSTFANPTVRLSLNVMIASPISITPTNGITARTM